MDVRQSSRRALAVVVAVLAGLLALVPAPAGAIVPSWTDPSFAGGAITVDVGAGAGHADANAVAVQADGKVVVVGTAYRPDNPLVSVLRFLADGRPDPGFGVAGQVFLGADGSGNDGKAVALQRDGRIVVAGTMQRRWDGRQQMAVVRLQPDGKLDTTFAGGIVTIEGTTLTSTAKAVAVQADGRIVLAGEGVPADFALPGALSQSHDFMVARVLPDGTRDGGFGQDGVALTNFGPPDSSDWANGLAVGSDGRIVLGGYSSEGFAMARYTSAGLPDPSFGTGGRVITVAPPATTTGSASGEVNALAMQPDGRIVTLGVQRTYEGMLTTGGAMVLARYLPDGRLDPSFGPGGQIIASTQPISGAAVVVTQTGRVIVAGALPDTFGIPGGALIAYTPAGALDSSFGRAGMVRLNLSGSNGLRALTVQADGRIVAVGDIWTDGQPQMLVTRFKPLDAISTVFAWGFNGKGQLGDDSLADAHAPVAVPGLSRINTVAAGAYHSLSVSDDGSVQAWGWNGAGALGDGTTVDRDTPVAVTGMTGASTVAAGYFHSLAVRGGKVWTWGWNGFGQLGDGTTTDRLVPVEVPGLSGVVAVAGGAFHSLALKADGTVWAWGWNGFGQLGDGTTTDRHLPVQVPGLKGVSVIAAGGFHSLASAGLGSAGSFGMWSWGFNGFGQLGIGMESRQDWHTPFWTPGNGPVALAGGAYHTLALFSDGLVRAWGFNGFGQLGDGTTVDSSFEFRAVAGLTDVTAIAAGIFHSVAVDGSGTVSSWGWNYFGQLGDGSTSDKHVPVQATGLTGASLVAAGAFHSVVPRVPR